MSSSPQDATGPGTGLAEPIGQSQKGTPTWEVAYLYPLQGEWAEAEYLALGSNQLIEFDDGCIEVLPMPKIAHQRIVAYLFEQFQRLIRQGVGGEVLQAPIPVRLWEGKYREPDLIYVRPGRLKAGQEYPDGADLVVEVVSDGPQDRVRDYEIKREEYARAGVSEYWIVDPQSQMVTVLNLVDDVYGRQCEYRPGEQIESEHFGRSLDVTGIFRAADGPAA